MKHRTRSSMAALALLCSALVACGGSDGDLNSDDVAIGDAPVPTSADDSAADPVGPPSAVEPPDATVSPSVPEEYLSAIGPVEVHGEALPPLGNADVASDPAVGEPAPVLVGLDLDGEPIRIDAAADGPTMVVFLAHWCPHCNAEIPRLNELRDDGRFPDGLQIVAVSTAVDPRRPNFPPGEWLDDKDWTFPAMADGIDMEGQTFIASDAFGVDSFPFVTLIDGDGRVAARWSGERDPDAIIDTINTQLGLS